MSIENSKTQVSLDALKYQARGVLMQLAYEIANTRSLEKPATVAKIQQATKIRYWLKALDSSAFLTQTQIYGIMSRLIELSGVYNFPSAPVLALRTRPNILTGVPGVQGVPGVVFSDNGTLFSATAGIGSTTADSFSFGLDIGAVWIYTVTNGTSQRTGLIGATWLSNGSAIGTGDDSSSSEIGDTSSIQLDAVISGGNINLVATSSTAGWTVSGKRILARTVSASGGGSSSSDTFASNFTVVLSGGKTFGKYVNGDVVPAAGLTAAQVILLACVDYLLPLFTSFAITGQSTQVELGTTIASGSKTFTWTTTNPSNINTNSISIVNVTGSSTMGSGLANTGTASLSFPTPNQLNTSGATQVFQINGVNTLSNTFSTTLTITANYKRFYGTPVATPATSADVRALSNSTYSSNFAISIAAGQQVISFAYEATRPDITNTSVVYKEGLNSPVGSTFTKQTFNVNDAGGTARSYKIYTATLPAPYPGNATYVVTIP